MTTTATPIPLLDLSAQNGPLLPEIRAAFERVAASNFFIMGPEIEAFEKEVAAYLGVPHAIGVSSGTDALVIALMALGIGQGDEVITTPFSFFATAGSIARVGAKPVFVDIDPRTFNLDVTKVEAAITPKTKAIMPVHLFGQAAEMIPLRAIASAKKLAIIEDAAQAIGAGSDAGRVGSVGTIGCFSFFPSKNLGCFGDGGLVTTTDAALAEDLRILRVHGGKPKYYHKVIGGNFRLDALQAAILRVKLPHLERWAQGRLENADRYDKLFTAAALPPEVLRLPQRVVPGHVFNQYTICTPKRDALKAHLTERKIGFEIYYPVPLHRQECFAYLGYAAGSMPHSERAANEVLSLPIFPELGAERQARVVEAVTEFLRRA